MKIKIINTIRKCIPEQEVWIDNLIKSNSDITENIVLRKTTKVYIDKLKIRTSDDLASILKIIKVITVLYNGNNQYMYNTIENKFFTELSFIENPTSLKEHLHLLPIKLQKEYLKTILEN